MDRVLKTDIYARHLIGWLWIIDPLAGTLEAFRLDQGCWVRVAAHVGDVCARIAPFDAAELACGTLGCLLLWCHGTA